jgi:N-acetylglucosaminyl-diphospho-decaprenol L-rhamnosyltransferase
MVTGVRYRPAYRQSNVHKGPPERLSDYTSLRRAKDFFVKSGHGADDFSPAVRSVLTMHVAVGIVGFRNSDDIARCLEALSLSVHADFEVVVCENGGPEAHTRLLAVLPRTLIGGQGVRAVLAPGNPGFAGGVNICLRETPDADAWWLLNPDTAPQPGALTALVARLGQGDCDAVGGPLHLQEGIIQSYGGLWQGWLARPISIGLGRAQDAPVAADKIERTQNYLNGASMLIGRRFISVVGPMREDYFLYCEEVEWCLRGSRRGMRLGFAPKARVLHFHGTTTGGGGGAGGPSRLAIYLGERNKMLLTRDVYPARLPLAGIVSLALLLARFGRRGAWSRLGHALSGWFDGLMGRRGAPQWLGG